MRTLILGLLSFSFYANAVTCDRLNDLWDEHFYDDFKVSWEFERFECPSPLSFVAKAFYDIWAPESDKDDEMPDFYLWATKYISETNMDENCADGLTAVMNKNTGKMSICEDFVSESDKVDEVWRASTLVHEAAHADPYDPGHVVCDHGAHQGKDGCDSKLTDSLNGSGNNVAFTYLKWVLEKTNYQELKSEKIRLTLKYLVLNRFNDVSQDQLAKWGGVPAPQVVTVQPRQPHRSSLSRDKDPSPPPRSQSRRSPPPSWGSPPPQPIEPYYQEWPHHYYPPPVFYPAPVPFGPFPGHQHRHW